MNTIPMYFSFEVLECCISGNIDGVLFHDCPIGENRQLKDAVAGILSEIREFR